MARLGEWRRRRRRHGRGATIISDILLNDCISVVFLSLLQVRRAVAIENERKTKK